MTQYLCTAYPVLPTTLCFDVFLPLETFYPKPCLSTHLSRLQDDVWDGKTLAGNNSANVDLCKTTLLWPTTRITNIKGLTVVSLDLSNPAQQQNTTRRNATAWNSLNLVTILWLVRNSNDECLFYWIHQSAKHTNKQITIIINNSLKEKHDDNMFELSLSLSLHAKFEGIYQLPWLKMPWFDATCFQDPTSWATPDAVMVTFRLSSGKRMMGSSRCLLCCA